MISDHSSVVDRSHFDADPSQALLDADPDPDPDPYKNFKAAGKSEFFSFRIRQNDKMMRMHNIGS
jgi:hypothetical protein